MEGTKVCCWNKIEHNSSIRLLKKFPNVDRFYIFKKLSIFPTAQLQSKGTRARCQFFSAVQPNENVPTLLLKNIIFMNMLYVLRAKRRIRATINSAAIIKFVIISVHSNVLWHSFLYPEIKSEHDYRSEVKIRIRTEFETESKNQCNSRQFHQ